MIDADRLYRTNEIIGNTKANPPIEAVLVNIAPSTWWKWVAEGRVSKGIKLSPRVTVWPGSELLKLRDGLFSQQSTSAGS